MPELGKRTAAIERRKRRLEVERVMLEGGLASTEQKRQLGARWDVSVSAINQDVRTVLDRWRYRDERTTKARKLKRRKELEHTKRLAAESYWLSRTDEVEITTDVELIRCEECGGSGIAEDEATGERDFCELCDGEGKTRQERVRKKIRGQAGDASFLRVMESCTKEMARLEGLYVEKHRHKVEGRVEHLHAHATITEEQLARLSDDQLLEMEAAQRRIVEGRVERIEDNSSNGNRKVGTD